MRSALVLLAATATLTAAPVPKDPKPGDDAALLLGAWKVESMIRDGESVPPDTSRWTFTGEGTLDTLNTRKVVSEWTFTIDPKAAPKRMTWTAKLNGTKWDCVYELKGDTLKIGFLDAHAKTPRAVEAGPTLILYELKREKAAK